MVLTSQVIRFIRPLNQEPLEGKGLQHVLLNTHIIEDPRVLTKYWCLQMEFVCEAGGMTDELRVLAVPAEDEFDLQHPQQQAHNQLLFLAPGDLMPSSGLLRHLVYISHVHTHTYTYLKLVKIKNKSSFKKR